MIEDGSNFDNYAHALEVILRLRQLCCHDSLLPEDTKDANAKTSSAPPTAEALERLLGVLRAGGLDDCCICLSAMYAPVVTRCAHVFCKSCIVPALERKPACPLCRQECKVGDLIEAPADETEGKENEDDPLGPAKPSAKVEALVQRLKMDLAPRASGERKTKAVVFSQFVQFLDIVQVAVREAGFKTCRLTGASSAANRDRAIREFQSHEDDTPDVMLVSLKAGGVGINLTAASRVYMLDPWWNPAVEEQAMDRVHRLGQTRDVEVVRFAARDSIEERMLDRSNANGIWPRRRSRRRRRRSDARCARRTSPCSSGWVPSEDERASGAYRSLRVTRASPFIQHATLFMRSARAASSTSSGRNSPSLGRRTWGMSPSSMVAYVPHRGVPLSHTPSYLVCFSS